MCVRCAVGKRGGVHLHAYPFMGKGGVREKGRRAASKPHATDLAGVVVLEAHDHGGQLLLVARGRPQGLVQRHGGGGLVLVLERAVEEVVVSPPLSGWHRGWCVRAWDCVGVITSAPSDITRGPLTQGMQVRCDPKQV